jgi:hypothetical protein
MHDARRHGAAFHDDITYAEARPQASPLLRCDYADL